MRDVLPPQIDVTIGAELQMKHGAELRMRYGDGI
jgi:hypothetical protein